ncbi:MAG: hypothetical protein QG591_2622, partial [Planctomycetota bacterium]|nr:hypothetical protein [Planctomycetota bacterium]
IFILNHVAFSTGNLKYLSLRLLVDVGVTCRFNLPQHTFVVIARTSSCMRPNKNDTSCPDKWQLLERLSLLSACRKPGLYISLRFAQSLLFPPQQMIFVEIIRDGDDHFCMAPAQRTYRDRALTEGM